MGGVVCCGTLRIPSGWQATCLQETSTASVTGCEWRDEAGVAQESHGCSLGRKYPVKKQAERQTAKPPALQSSSHPIIRVPSFGVGYLIREP